VRGRTRVAVISTHVIQHFPPMYRRLTAEGSISLRVFYASTAGSSAYTDPGFGHPLAWDSDLLSGYEYEFLPAADNCLRTGFFGLCGRGLERRLHAYDPDSVFLFGYTPLLMLRTLAYARRRGLKVFMMTDSELLHKRARWKRVIKALVLPTLFRQVTGFLTIGDNNERYLRKYGVPERRLVRGGYPTDEDRFLAVREQRKECRTRARRAWGIPPDAFVALFVGKLIPRKRPCDLAEAVVRLRGAHPSAMAVFAGDGELRGQVESFAGRTTHSAIRLLGFVNQTSLPDAYAAADVLVHPAAVDPHPLSLTEAAMVGLPVVVSNQVGAIGLTDTARPGVNALVYRMGDVSELERCLCALLTDRELYNRMQGATGEVAAQTGLAACAQGFRHLVMIEA
jgi:glycosyltransferase involved in cell wall biosynthesis